jgi:peptide/nickel transport system substrate-binding protein
MRARRRHAVWLLLTSFAMLGATACPAPTDRTDAASGAGDAPSGTVAEAGRADLTLESDGATPRQGGSATFGLATETDGWNPATSRWSASGYIVGFSIFDPLMAYDDQLVPQPYLARSMTPDATFSTWTIELRPSVTFHDGSPVDAAAVVANLDAQLASGLTAQTLSFIDDVRAVDPLHVEVTMSHPWSGFPNMLTSQVGAIASPTMLAAGAEGTRNPVGSGPFRFVSWVSGSSLRTERNPSYWRAGYPHLDELEFEIAPDVTGRGNAFRAGDLDLFETSDPRQITTFTEAAQAGESQIFTDQRTDGPKVFLALNHATAPFDDPVARQAVAHAIDRDELSGVAFEGVFPPVSGPFSESSPNYSAEAAAAVPGYDIDEARALAAQYQATHGQPLSFTLSLSTSPESAQLGQVLLQQLDSAGIDVQLETTEPISLILKIFGGQYQAGTFSLFASPSIDTNYAFIAGPAGPIGDTSLNFARVSAEDNAELIAALDEARTTDDPERQRAQYAIVQREMAENLGFVFLVRLTTAVVYSNEIRGAQRYPLPGPDGEPAGLALARTAPMTFDLWRTA